jgi:hypothetical protein
VTDDREPGVKMLTTFFAGIILTGVTAFVTYPHNLATKDDLSASQEITQKEMADVQAQLAAAQAVIATTQNEVTRTRIQVGKISYKLNIPDNE